MSTYVNGDTLVVWWKSDADGWYAHPESPDNAEAAEQVGQQLLDSGADEVMICAAGEKPWQIDVVLTEYDRNAS